MAITPTKKKKIRADKQKTTAKVLKAIIKNPLQTEREIAQSAGVGNGTVNRAKKELEQTGAKIPGIEEICKADFEIVKLAQKETVRRLRTPEQESFQDIIRAGAESTKRYSLFMGDITDEKGGLKKLSVEEIQNLPDTDLLNLLNDDGK